MFTCTPKTSPSNRLAILNQRQKYYQDLMKLGLKLHTPLTYHAFTEIIEP